MPDDFDPERVSWRTWVGTGFSGMAVVGGRLYTMGHEEGHEIVWCLDALTGQPVWSDRYPAALLPHLHEGGPAATPAVAGGRVFTLGKDGQLRAYGADDGQLAWSRSLMEDAGMEEPPEWGFSGSPLLVGDLLVAEAGITLGLDSASGEIRWRSQPFRAGYGSPAHFRHQGEDRLAVLKTDGLVVLDPGNGGTLAFDKWETSFQTNASTPLAKGDALFISTGYDRGCALYRFDGRRLAKRYENQRLSVHMSDPVLVDGYLYGFDGTAHRGRPVEFVCLEWESGQERWRVPASEGLGCGSLSATPDGQLLILSERGELLLAPASPEGFAPQWRAQILGGRCWTPPAIAGGRVYVRNARGELACVGAVPPAAD